MSVRTYKHFNKSEELFAGLGLLTLLKLGAIFITLVIVAIQLKLALNSPLLLLLAILVMIVMALVIKADSDVQEVGFYSSLLTHPFQNHIFPLFGPNDKYSKFIIDDELEVTRSANPFDIVTQKHQEFIQSNNQIHQTNLHDSLYGIQPIRNIAEDFVVTKDGSMLCYLKLEEGLALSNMNDQDKEQVLDHWSALLSQINNISNINNYLIYNDKLGDALQAFVVAKPYEYKPGTVISNTSKLYKVTESEKLLENYCQSFFANSKFIPDFEFYLVIKHKLSKAKINPLHKALKQILPGWLAKDFICCDTKTFYEEYELLEQKFNSCNQFLTSIGLKYSRLQGSELRSFVDSFIPLSSIETPAEINSNSFVLKDKAKYIQLNDKLAKTYKITVSPENKDLNFWLYDYFYSIGLDFTISVQWTPRDALQDRRKAESKADLMQKMTKSSKSSTQNIINENREIADKLFNLPHSFDLDIYITVYARDLEALQKLDNVIKKPIRGAQISSLDRQQVRHWINALPFASVTLAAQDRLFANLDYASACFPFIETKLGTKSGPLLGISLESMKPVYLDEYNRSLCNNRAINFIGDSGSGKTVAAKLAIKRRLNQGGSFVIIDQTKDGWSFFVNYFGGKIVEIDSATDFGSKAYFAPFVLPASYSEEDLRLQIADLSNLLCTIRGLRINTQLESFLNHSLRTLYESYGHKPCLSDLYKLWSQELDSNQDFGGLNLLDLKLWLDSIAPYCKSCSGIYSNLMDSSEAMFDYSHPLLLFTFSKLKANPQFVELSLYLISNLLQQRIIHKAERQITLVLDEAWKLLANNRSELGRDLIIHFARAGRGLDLGLWTISQKPADLPREVHSSASVNLSFQLKERQDRSEMSAAANFTEAERNLLEHKEIYNSGTCLLKTTRNSGLIKIILDPIEEILCNSTRSFVTKRDALLKDYLQDYPEHIAAAKSLEDLLMEDI